ncbi:MAG: CDP-2,3-bis-(O-geranylgeranyl)-sn-glycerol synthase [Thermoplasmata archaeon]|jgi:CDP-2,3-bis-(O-geranylgeranyl)-sn-glycerol synthase|nr:CDP-2,3-bis-(O-geranylgeranyl)-sn-glycerol synthase [Thermoplasmata archaeon]
MDAATWLALWAVVSTALWLNLPAYLGNMMPVFMGGGRPIDGGRLWRDGKPILGPGKTWRGLLVGPLISAVLCGLLRWLVVDTHWHDYEDWSAWGPAPWWFVMVYMMGLGALVGDAVKSFFKRRTGRERGASWPVFDQLDFVVGSLVFAAIAGFGLAALGLTDHNVFLSDFTWPRLLAIVILTPGLHLLVNVIGYWLKLKDVPW